MKCIPQYPALVNPTVPVVPEATAKDRELGNPDETGVLDLTTEIFDAVFRAAQASKASVVPLVRG